MGETRDRLIERLKVPKIWDKRHRVCPRKRCILAVLLYLGFLVWADQRVENRVALAAKVIGASQNFAKGDCALGNSGVIHHQNPLELRLVADGVQLVELLAR